MADKSVTKLPTDDTPLISSDSTISINWKTSFEDIVRKTKEVRKRIVTVDPTSVSANTTSEQTFTLSGVASDDIIIVTKPSHTTGLGIVNYRVSSKDTVAVTFMNTTGSSIDPPEEDYIITVIKA